MSAEIRIHTAENVAAAAVAWRYRGRLSVSVIVKARFGLLPPHAPLRPEIVRADRQIGHNPLRSLEAASDLAPYLHRCDVTLVGRAHAPQGRAVEAASVRLALSRDGQVMLDRALRVLGDAGATGRAPFTSMPLVHERAVGGPGQPNPFGTDQPNLVDPTDPRRVACLAPLSRLWPGRKALLGKIDRAALDAPIADIPEAMAWEFYQSAPPDQRVDHLRGGEVLVVEGVHAAHARIEVRLPMVRGAARVRAAGAATETAVDLVCDTLAIDGESESFSVVWRGRYEVTAGEAALAGLTVLAALEAPGVPVDWKSIGAAPAAPPPSRAPVSIGRGDGTVSLAGDAAIPAPATPFAIAPPGPSSARPNVEATPWSQKPLAAPPTGRPGDETIGTPAAQQTDATVSMGDAEQRAAAQAPASPFVATPRDPRLEAEALAQRLRACGAGIDDVTALLRALGMRAS